MIWLRVRTRGAFARCRDALDHGRRCRPADVGCPPWPGVAARSRSGRSVSSAARGAAPRRPVPRSLKRLRFGVSSLGTAWRLALVRPSSRVPHRTGAAPDAPAGSFRPHHKIGNSSATARKARRVGGGVEGAHRGAVPRVRCAPPVPVKVWPAADQLAAVGADRAAAGGAGECDAAVPARR